MSLEKILINFLKNFFSSLSHKEVLELFGGEEKFINSLKAIFQDLDEERKKELRKAVLGDYWERFERGCVCGRKTEGPSVIWHDCLE